MKPGQKVIKNINKFEQNKHESIKKTQCKKDKDKTWDPIKSKLFIYSFK